jgi:uncharacterized protein YndB with AHSA1/START domain
MSKQPFEIEFPVKASPHMIFPFLSTPSGLSEWFCDDVNSRGEIFRFQWDGSEEAAKLLSLKNEKYIRFRWLADEEEGSDAFFEFRLVVDELTHDTSLLVKDYAEAGEEAEQRLWWESQIHRLFHTIGA